MISQDVFASVMLLLKIWVYGNLASARTTTKVLEFQKSFDQRYIREFGLKRMFRNFV